MKRRLSVVEISCQVCNVHCTKLSCACVCTFEGPEYMDCLEISKELNSSKESLEDDDSIKNFRNRLRLNCDRCCLHLECKKCVGYRCGCIASLTKGKKNEPKIETKDQNQAKTKNSSTSRFGNVNNDLIRSTNQHTPLSIDRQLLSTSISDNNPEIGQNLDVLYSQVDKNFKKLLSSNPISSTLLSNFLNSIKELRSHEKRRSYDQKTIDQQNYDLDQCLNRSFRKTNREGDDMLIHQKEVYMNKFDLFVYLCLSQCSVLERKIMKLYPESNVKETIKNLCLFINEKRSPEEQLINARLRICLQNSIDTIELNYTDKEDCLKLFVPKLSISSSFKFLNFLLLNFNDSARSVVTLQLDSLIALRHLEIHGRRFEFKRSNWKNTSLVNLILHDKCIKNTCILDHFPNLLIVKIRNSTGDILKPARNYFNLSKKLNGLKNLHVVSVQKLSINDFFYVMNFCRNIELIECTLIEPSMLCDFKFPPNLKFVFFNLKSEHHCRSKSLIDLIYHLTKSNVHHLYYTNQLYCPLNIEIDRRTIGPCFKLDCVNCVKIKGEDVKRRFPAYSADRTNKKTSSAKNISSEKNLRKNESDCAYSKSFQDLKNFEQFLNESSTDQADQSKLKHLNYQSNEFQRITVYLNGIRLHHLTMKNLIKFYEMRPKSNYLKISEFNKLVKLIGVEWMKEKLSQLEFIEIDESIEMSDLMPSISHSICLIVRVLDKGIANLIERMSYLKTIKLYDINIDRLASEQLFGELKKVTKHLRSFEIRYDRTESCSLEILRHCNSLHELKLINVIVKIDELGEILIRNTYCTKVELSYLSKNDHLNLIEILSFNALLHKNLNFILTSGLKYNLNLTLPSNLKLKAV